MMHVDMTRRQLLNALLGSDFVLDGEICVMKDGNEDFSGIVGAVKRKGHTIENPKFFVFDILTISFLKVLVVWEIG